MKKPTPKQQRSWITTIVASMVAALAFYVAFDVYTPNTAGMLAVIAMGLFGVLATITAIEGRPRTLRWLVDSLTHL